MRKLVELDENVMYLEELSVLNYHYNQRVFQFIQAILSLLFEISYDY